MENLKRIFNNLSKKEKGQYITVTVSVLVMVISIIGYTYSYYSATVNYNNKTQTSLKTKEIDLIYTGVHDISTGAMIPGESYEKTFTVYNPSSKKLTYNIYMEQITNEFNEDLVYTLIDDEGIVVEDIPLPETSTEKEYLIINREITASTIQNFTLRITFKDTGLPQNDMQGAKFNAYLGIDADQIKISATAVEYSNSEHTECENVDCSLNELYDQIIGE